MKLLSAKNKKFATMAFFWFGLVVFALIIVRVARSGAKHTKEYVANFKDEITELFSFASVTILLLSAVALLLDWRLGFGSAPFMLYGVAIGTLTTGAAVVSTFNTTYVPKYFTYTAATQLTGVKITVQGDGVIFDSDANGLNHAGTNRLFGQITNGFYFRIANGFIKGKNVIWEFTNSAAQTPVVYVDSDETPPDGGAMYLQLLRQAVLANSGQNFDDFATLSFPSLGATDVVNMLFNDGTQQQMNRADLQALLQLTQNVVNTPIYLIDNFAGRCRLVNILGAAQTAYVQRWVAAQSGQMISQVVNNS